MNGPLFFKQLRRFNALLPAMTIALLVIVVAWAYYSDRRNAVTVPSVIPPNTDTASAKLEIWPTGIDASDTLVMKVVARSAEGRAYERATAETVNLVFLRNGADAANWLFPDQSLVISSLHALIDGNNTLAIYMETGARPRDGRDSKDRVSPLVDLHLVSSDGLRHLKLLAGLDRVISHRLYGHTLQLVYQQGQAVKSMRIALPGFEVISDQIVANLAGRD